AATAGWMGIGAGRGPSGEASGPPRTPGVGARADRIVIRCIDRWRLARASFAGDWTVIGRLTAFDLPGRLERLAPRLVVQAAVGLLLAGAVVGLRAMAEG